MFFYNDNGENMKNRGFTLVELLGVITLIGLLALAAFELLDSVNKGNKEKAEEIQIKNILAGAISYVPTSRIVLPNVADAYVSKSWGTNCKGDSVSPKQMAQLSYDSIEEENTGEARMAKDGYQYLCDTTLTLKFLSELGIIEEKIKNPISGKNYSFSESRIHIFYVTDRERAETTILNYNQHKPTKMEKPWEFDGNYMYIFEFKDEG